MSKRRGRPPTTKSVPIEKIVMAYRKFGTVVGVAEALTLSPKTVRKYLHEKGIKTNEPMYFVQVDHRYNYGCIAEWLRNNPNKKLPNSLKEIVAITKCSYNSARSYLYRRRKSVKKMASEVIRYIKQLGTVRMTDIDGVKFLTTGMTSINLEHKQYKGEAELVIHFGDTVRVVKINSLEETLLQLRKYATLGKEIMENEYHGDSED